jgi:biotin carboxyl carrier protein
MPRTVRFEWEGKVYEVGVERAGDRLTLIRGEKRYVVTLLPEQREPKVSPPPASTQAPPAASPQASVVQAPAGGPAPTASPAAAPTAAAAAELNSSGALHAPMTGVIKEIKVGPGFNVEQDQIVMIMEAMKMDIDIPSPASGVVAEVLVKVGDTVSAQQKLMVIH